MTSSDIARCPFCGACPTVSRRAATGRVNARVTIGCRNAECPCRPSTARLPFDEAIAAWNRRADPEAAQWRAKLSAVMPQDFKDWWQSHPAHWPDIAAMTIVHLRERERLAWEQIATPPGSLEGGTYANGLPD